MPGTTASTLGQRAHSCVRAVAWMGREWRDDEGDGWQWWRSSRCWRSMDGATASQSLPREHAPTVHSILRHSVCSVTDRPSIRCGGPGPGSTSRRVLTRRLRIRCQNRSSASGSRETASAGIPQPPGRLRGPHSHPGWDSRGPRHRKNNSPPPHHAGEPAHENRATHLLPRGRSGRHPSTTAPCRSCPTLRVGPYESVKGSHVPPHVTSTQGVSVR